MTDDIQEALELVRAWAIQAHRELAGAEALVEDKREALAAALDQVAAKELILERRKAREPVALVGVPEPLAKTKASAWSHIRNEMVWIEDDPSCGFLSCSCGWWGWHPWAGSDLDHLGVQKHQIVTTALKDWIEHIQLVTTGREEPSQ